MEACPCKDRKKRTLPCHDTCPAYLSWRDAAIKANKARSADFRAIKEKAWGIMRTYPWRRRR